MHRKKTKETSVWEIIEETRKTRSMMDALRKDFRVVVEEAKSHLKEIKETQRKFPKR